MLDWADALDSELYVAGTGLLFNTISNTYCCLGVYGRVCGMDDERLHGSSYLTDDERPDWMSESTMREYVRLNDTLNLTFTQIAQIVRTIDRNRRDRDLDLSPLMVAQDLGLIRITTKGETE
jgi:hypothetical protein